VAGDRGKVVIEDGNFVFVRNEVPTSEFNRTSNKSFAKPATERLAIAVEGKGEQHAGILRNFTDACLLGTPLVAPAAEGLRSFELANAMLLSSATESTIALPMDGNAFEVWLQERIATSRYTKPVINGGIATDFADSNR